MHGSAATRTPLSSEYGPFLPGTGALPPYMAGRQQEQNTVEEYLDFLEQGMAPPSPLIFYGPRGNGKTALLHWTRRRALDRGIEVINLGTAEVRTEGIADKPALARHLVDRSIRSRIPAWRRIAFAKVQSKCGHEGLDQGGKTGSDSPAD